MNGLNFTNMYHKMEECIAQDHQMFMEANETILKDQENAEKQMSPGKVKLCVY